MFTNLAFLIGKSKVVLRTTRGDDGSFVDDKIYEVKLVLYGLL